MYNISCCLFALTKIAQTVLFRFKKNKHRLLHKLHISVLNVLEGDHRYKNKHQILTSSSNPQLRKHQIHIKLQHSSHLLRKFHINTVINNDYEQFVYVKMYIRFIRMLVCTDWLHSNKEQVQQ